MCRLLFVVACGALFDACCVVLVVRVACSLCVVYDSMFIVYCHSLLVYCLFVLVA